MKVYVRSSACGMHNIDLMYLTVPPYQRDDWILCGLVRHETPETP